MNDLERARTTPDNQPHQTSSADTHPMRHLRDAFTARRILNYREGDALVVNDPYLRQRVEVTFNGRWFVWTAPSGEHAFGDPARVTDTVDRLIAQYAGIYFEAR
jgi:hypothetical protein